MQEDEEGERRGGEGQGREEGRERERTFRKADTRRDAARKFYCRSLRGFHLQIPRAFLFSRATREPWFS